MRTNELNRNEYALRRAIREDFGDKVDYLKFSVKKAFAKIGGMLVPSEDGYTEEASIEDASEEFWKFLKAGYKGNLLNDLKMRDGQIKVGETDFNLMDLVKQSVDGSCAKKVDKYYQEYSDLGNETPKESWLNDFLLYFEHMVKQEMANKYTSYDSNGYKVKTTERSLRPVKHRMHESRKTLNIKHGDVLNGYGSAKKAQDFYDMVNEAIDDYELSLNALPNEDAKMLTHGPNHSDLFCGYCGAEIEYGQDTCPECGAHLNTSLDDCCGGEEDCLCDEYAGLEEKAYKLPTRFTPKKDTHWKGARKASLTEGGYVTFTNHIGEKDSFYDPNKSEPSLSELDAAAMESYDVGSGVDYWLKRFEGKTPDYNSLDGLNRLANIWYNVETSDQVHDLQHDGAYQDAKDCANALSKMRSKIMSAIQTQGLTSANTKEALQLICKGVEKNAKNKASAEKRAATKAANQGARFEKYKAAALQVQNEELRALLNDDGSLKDRRSWGTIKDYLSTDEGKTFKNLWVNQFR